MKTLLKYILCGLFVFVLTSCSVILGGFAAIDNAAYKGPNEIKQEEVKRLREGKKMILTLTDSTRIAGYYEGYEEAEKDKLTIMFLDEEDKLRHIGAHRITKYVYIDGGTNVWIAAGVGAVIDASIIAFILSSKQGGFGGKVF